jgi:hypothetical protein
MIAPNLTVKLKRIAIAAMAVALLITSSMLVMREPPRQDHATVTSGNIINDATTMTAAPQQAAHGRDRLASVAVIILNKGKDSPVGIKVGEKYIEIPGPSSWPPSSGHDASGTEQGRFLAGIIDTADVLKANGFRPDDTFSFVVGGTALNASNTFQVVGNHRPDGTLSNADGYSEEFHNRPDEGGIWRSLAFKNIVLSYGQIPSLADFLVGSQISPTKKTMLNGTSAQGDQQPSAIVNDTMKTEKDIQKYREALNSSDPAVRAEGIQNLMMFGDPLTSDPSHPGIATYIEKALADNDPAVRDATLRSLDMWDGDIPMQTLSKLALNDQSPEVRMRALGLLADRFDEQAVPTLQQASHDPDSRVAQKASQLLQAYAQ